MDPAAVELEFEVLRQKKALEAVRSDLEEQERLAAELRAEVESLEAQLAKPAG